MAEWIYRAVARVATWDATEECLLTHQFLCRSVYRKGGGLINRVADVRSGDCLHVVMSLGAGLEHIGSFLVQGSIHPDCEGLVDNADRGTLALQRVRSGSLLEEALIQAGYGEDQVLHGYTGWYVVEQDKGDLAIPSLSPRNALTAFPDDRVPAAVVESATVPLLPSVPSPQVTTDPSKEGVAIGVDWSGAANAGKKIWAVRLLLREAGAELENLGRPFRGKRAPEVAAGFADWLTEQEFDVAGLDFCFGLAEDQFDDEEGMPRTGPGDLGQWLAEHYSEPDSFKLGVGAERKRHTDRDRKSPFAPTNLRMYRQTYWGLRSLSNLRDPILPWGKSGKRVVIEVLPAHVAGRLCRGCTYKGRSTEAREGRLRLLAAARATFGLVVKEADAATIRDDPEGDALDAVLAALGAAAARANDYAGAPRNSASTGEGWIYSVE